MAPRLATRLRPILGFLWPGVCPACGAASPEDLLCPPCLRSTPRLPEAERRVSFPEGLEVVCLHPYAEPLRSVLLRLKYGGSAHGARALAAVVLAGARDPRALGRPDGVVPVPLTAARLRRRGFNQTRLLAGPLATHLAVPVEPELLRRRGRHRPQVALGGPARRRNLRGAFRAAPVPGRALLVVDDVLTTGATMRAAARALLGQGARRVQGLCLLRTPPPGVAGIRSAR